MDLLLFLAMMGCSSWGFVFYAETSSFPTNHIASDMPSTIVAMGLMVGWQVYEYLGGGRKEGGGLGA